MSILRKSGTPEPAFEPRSPQKPEPLCYAEKTGVVSLMCDLPASHLREDPGSRHHAVAQDVTDRTFSTMTATHKIKIRQSEEVWWDDDAALDSLRVRNALRKLQSAGAEVGNADGAVGADGRENGEVTP